MLTHRDIARALLIEAHADLEAARVLRQAGIYARCIAHCQHTVEKALKAALAVRDVIITDRHEVSEEFHQTYADWSLCDELADVAVEMESIGFREGETEKRGEGETRRGRIGEWRRKNQSSRIGI